MALVLMMAALLQSINRNIRAFGTERDRTSADVATQSEREPAGKWREAKREWTRGKRCEAKQGWTHGEAARGKASERGGLSARSGRMRLEGEGLVGARGRAGEARA